MRCLSARVRRTAPFETIIMQAAACGCTWARETPGEPRPRRATRRGSSSTSTCRCSSTPDSSSARSARAWTAASRPSRGTRTTSPAPPTSAASTACEPSSTPSSSGPAPWPRTTPASPCGEVEGENPVRVVLDPSGRLGADRTVFRDGAARTVWWSGAPPAGRTAERPARDTLELPADPASADGSLAPAAIVAALREQGSVADPRRGGAAVTVSRFLEAGVLTRLHVTVAPLVIGSGRHALDLPPRPVARPRPAAPVPAVPARRRRAVRPRPALTWISGRPPVEPRRIAGCMCQIRENPRRP